MSHQSLVLNFCMFTSLCSYFYVVTLRMFTNFVLQERYPNCSTFFLWIVWQLFNCIWTCISLTWFILHIFHIPVHHYNRSWVVIPSFLQSFEFVTFMELQGLLVWMSHLSLVFNICMFTSLSSYFYLVSLRMFTNFVCRKDSWTFFLWIVWHISIVFEHAFLSLVLLFAFFRYRCTIS